MASGPFGGRQQPQLTPELLQLLQALSQSRELAAPTRPQMGSALGLLQGLPAPAETSRSGMTPEELAALAVSKPSAPAQEEASPFASMLPPPQQQAAQEEGVLSKVLQVIGGLGRGAPSAAPGVPAPEVYGPPMPAAPVEPVQGPPVPTPEQYALLAQQQALANPVPPPRPPEAEIYGPPIPPAMGIPLPAPRPPIDSVNTGTRRGESPGDPNQRGEPVTPPTTLWDMLPEGSAAAAVRDAVRGAPGALYEGFENLASRYAENVRRSTVGPEGRQQVAVGTTPGTNAPPETAPAFKYSYPGAVQAASMAPRTTRTTIDTNTGEVSTGSPEAPRPQYRAGGGEVTPSGAMPVFARGQGTREDVERYVREAAIKRGIDPDVAARVIKQESSFNPGALGDAGKSFGVMQLYTGGGLGNEARKRGISLDPTNWRQQVDFGLDVVKEDGWRQWYGARDVGIGRWQGIKGGGGGGGGRSYADGPPGRTPREVDVLPNPPDRPMPAGVDFSRVMEELRKIKPFRQAPMDAGEKFATVLGRMAAGAASAPGSEWGRVIAGAGSGAALGAADIKRSERGEAKSVHDQEVQIAKMMAQAYEQEATSNANTENARRETRYRNERDDYEVAVQNSRMRRAERNAALEYQDKIDYEAWKEGRPQVQANEKGISVIQRTPDGKVNITTTSYQQQDKMMDQIKERAGVMGLDDNGTRAMIYDQAAKMGGELGVRRAMLDRVVEKNALANILGPSTYADLQKQIDKDIPNANVMKATQLKQYTEAFNARAKDILMRNMLSGNLPDTWIEEMALTGDPAAMQMVPPERLQQLLRTRRGTPSR